MAGKRKWPRNVKGHWQTGGANILCLLINGVRVCKYTWTPPSSSFSCLSTAWHGWMRGFFPPAFKKRLSHKNIVTHHENISNTFPSVMGVWFIHLPPRGLWRRRREGTDERRSADTNSQGSVFSLSLCHKGQQVCLGTALESYWSRWVLLLYIAKLCPHPHTPRKTIQE